MDPHCPHGHGPLIVTAAEGHTGWRCAQCAGLWLPAAFLEQIAVARDFDIVKFQGRLAEAVTGAAPIPCAEGHACSATEYRTLELDWCPTCRGVWFDAGELRRLLDLHPNEFREGETTLFSFIADLFLPLP